MVGMGWVSVVKMRVGLSGRDGVGLTGREWGWVSVVGMGWVSVVKMRVGLSGRDGVGSQWSGWGWVLGSGWGGSQW